MSFVSFEKFFFPTVEEIEKSNKFIEDSYNKQLEKYMALGLSKEKSIQKIEEEVEEFMNRGYYS